MCASVLLKFQDDRIILSIIPFHLYIYFIKRHNDRWYDLGFPCGTEVKNSTANAEDTGSIPGSGKSPGVGNGNSPQYSYLENPMDRGAWWVTIHGITKSWT